MSKDWKKYEGVTSVQIGGSVYGLSYGCLQLALRTSVLGLGFWQFCFGHITSGRIYRFFTAARLKLRMLRMPSNF